jgi:hypothetical protein
MSLPKSYDEFQNSFQSDEPPEMWPEALKALWWDARGNWEASHEIAQEISSDIGCWIHGYLHRKEGDKWNAGYWYQRAGRSFPTATLEEESKEMVLVLLKK